MPTSRKYSKNTQTSKKSTKTQKASGKRAPRRTSANTPAKRKSSSSSSPGSLPLSARIRGLFRRNPKPKTNRSSRSSSGKSEKAAPRQPIVSGLSLDRKLDLIGMLLVLVLGFPTMLSMFSNTHSTPVGVWLGLLKKGLGWGAYLFPITSILVGLWLILRNFERVPQLAVERLMGLALLYFNVVVWIHFFTFYPSTAASFALAEAGKGGGYAGAVITEILQGNLGWGGTAIALTAWLLIALTLTLDVSVVDLFAWVNPLIIRLQDALDDLRNNGGIEPFAFLKRFQRKGRRTAPVGERSMPDGLANAAGLPVVPGVSTMLRDGEQTLAWVLPNLEDILEVGGEVARDDEVDRVRASVIEETLASFGAPVNVVEINRGPTITQFGVEPDFVESRNGRTRVRVGKITSLADDLALALAARTIRVQAPVPGKGYVGIEVPNEDVAIVTLRDVLESEAFHRLKSPLRFALGQDVAGNAVAADLAAMPHLLIAGATGSGKSVCVNAFICCLLLNNTPEELRLLMVDPKRVELTGYNGIPHLLAPVVVDLERVVGALQWVTREMDQRYRKLAEAGTRNILDYNEKAPGRGEKPMSRLVVIIDELADLMMLAPDETERTITRLAQLARATGIHLVIATQRPSVDVVTGLIKANIPSRVAFAVASGVDSRVILDQPGAERLLGRGDMLFQAPDAAAPIRLQGVFVSEAEISRLVDYWRGFMGQAGVGETAAGGVVDAVPAGIPLKQIPLWEEMEKEDKDVLLDEAIDLVRRQGRASISMLQRRLRIGYTRAARLIETMQDQGVVGKEAGPQGFEVLDYGPAAPPSE